MKRTFKQRQASMKNFTKARLKGAYSAIQFALNIDLTGQCHDDLKGASTLLDNALIHWDDVRKEQDE